MKEAYHINYVLEQLDLAAKYRQRVNLKAWKKDGNEVAHVNIETLFHFSVSFFIIEKRSSAEKRYFFSLFTAITTKSSSKRAEPRSITLRCPNVGGSKDPAKTALCIIK